MPDPLQVVSIVGQCISYKIRLFDCANFDVPTLEPKYQHRKQDLLFPTISSTNFQPVGLNISQTLGEHTGEFP